MMWSDASVCFMVDSELDSGVDLFYFNFQSGYWLQNWYLVEPIISSVPAAFPEPLTATQPHSTRFTSITSFEAQRQIFCGVKRNQQHHGPV